MSAFYGIQGHARRGVAPGGSGGSVGQAIASIVWDRTVPDSTYVPAFGGTLTAADYPEYAALLNMAPIPNVRLADAAILPSSTAYYSMHSSHCFSDNGEWLACSDKGDTNGGATFLYRIINGVTTRVASLAMPDPNNSLGSTGFISVSNNGDVAVYLSGSKNFAYFFIYRNNGNGTWSLMTRPALFDSNAIPVYPTWTKDGTCLVFGQTVPGVTWQTLLTAWQLPASLASTAMVVRTVTMPNMPTFPLNINRNADGDRWVITFNTASNNVLIYDVVDLTFTPIAKQITANIFFGNPSFSPDGLTLLLGAATFEVWSETSKGSGFNLIGRQVPASNTNEAFLIGDNYVVTSYTLGGTCELWAITIGGINKISSDKLYASQLSAGGMCCSRDGSTTVAGYFSATYFSITKIGTPPSRVPIPTAPYQGYGINKLIPFVKVRS